MRYVMSVCLAILAASAIHAQFDRRDLEGALRPQRAEIELAFGQNIDSEIAAGEEAHFAFRAPTGERQVVVSTYSAAGNVHLAVIDNVTGETLCANDSAEVEKPCSITFGDEPRALEIVVTGDTFASYRLSVGASAVVTNATIVWPVPYIAQQPFINIGESACGPTSLTMLLRYYYPYSDVVMPEVYRSGTQAYRYESGPAIGYRNVGFAMSSLLPRPDTGLTIVPTQYRTFYPVQDSSAVMDYIKIYLDRIWGISVTDLGGGQTALLNALKNGPVLARVNGAGNTANKHFLTVIGVTADAIVVNDPYVWSGVSGNGRKIATSTFFGSWYKEGFVLNPPDSLGARQYTTVVDVAHSAIECSCTPAGNRFTVEEPFALWNTYYGYGKSYYTPTVGGKAARWTPRLYRNGSYRVAVKYEATNASGSVRYSVIAADGREVSSTSVNQQGSGWKYAILGTFTLTSGASVKAWSIPANTRVSAVKFIYVP
ncbi:MAG: hypothetical protein QOE82_1353 [Thermoanaerobaculia bacterium]|jgi:hypothetical protein|nr:hypothetical protein [Thermoanaerobaculia bacterium]